MPFSIPQTPLICIGCGGISYGWIHPLCHLYVTGALPFASITLIDGKKFDAHHHNRQFGDQGTNKAQNLVEQWRLFYPAHIKLPLSFVPAYLTEENITALIPSGAAILLSPDNHETRRLVTKHLSTLPSGLLIAGGNNAISESDGASGLEGSVLVHFRIHHTDITPPLTYHHPNIRDAVRPISSIGCDELIQAGATQILITNLMIGQLMVQLLWRYLTMSVAEATAVVEVWINLSDFSLATYSLAMRPSLD